MGDDAAQILSPISELALLALRLGPGRRAAVSGDSISRVVKAMVEPATMLARGHPVQEQSGGADPSIPCTCDSDFCNVLHERNFIVHVMIELEVYAAGVRDLNKILELDHELEAVPGLRYKVDSNHDLVYMELEEPVITFREIRAIFRQGSDLSRVLSVQFPPSCGPK